MRERNLRVRVIGAGGTGSMFLDGLASLHSTLIALNQPGLDVTAIDFDTVSEWNLGRQRFTRQDIGLPKAISLIHRINGFYGCRWVADPSRATAKDAKDCDLFVTCVDSASFRYEVGRAWTGKTTDALWLDLGCGVDNGQCILGNLGKAAGNIPRIPNVFDFYKQQLRVPPKDDLPSCSMEEALSRQSLPVNRIVADLALNLLYHLIRNGALDHHGVQFQLNPMRTAVIPVDPSAWSMYGYEERS
ncbi:MAG: hypothetical protein BGP25_15765 [Lysobacterales bacterium 63-13]|nr:MAG: hypothetical protein BGP25_15765 [Xanthomonadales bacterium 63-13]